MLYFIHCSNKSREYISGKVSGKNVEQGKQWKRSIFNLKHLFYLQSFLINFYNKVRRIEENEESISKVKRKDWIVDKIFNDTVRL